MLLLIDDSLTIEFDVDEIYFSIFFENFEVDILSEFFFEKDIKSKKWRI